MKTKLTYKDIAIIKYSLLPANGPKAWIILRRGLLSKLQIPNEEKVLNIAPPDSTGNCMLSFLNAETMLTEMEITFTEQEVKFLKDMVGFVEENNGYTDFNFDTLDKIENL